MRQRRLGSAQTGCPSETRHFFWIGGYGGGAWVVWWSETLYWTLKSWWTDRTGGTDGGFVRERVCFGESETAAV